MRLCDANLINSRERLDDWVKNLVKDIDMKAYGEPIICWFGEKGTNKEGYTVVQLIETSNIIFHGNKSDCSGYLDIFTCKYTKDLQKKIDENIMKYFKPAYYTIEKIYRQA